MGSSQSLAENTEPFYPTEKDVLSLQKYLLPYLPVELIDAILDMAEYWPSVHAERFLDVEVFSASHDDSLYPSSELCYLVTPRIPRKARLIKQVVIQTESHDQGWGGEPEHRGTYNGSWTWFEAAILRSDNDNTPWWLASVAHGLPVDLFLEGKARTQAELVAARGSEVVLPGIGTSRWHVTANLTGRAEYKRHTLCWRRDDDCQPGNNDRGWRGSYAQFVDALEAGDRVALIVKTKFPLWTNHVRQASVDIFYTI